MFRCHGNTFSLFERRTKFEVYNMSKGQLQVPSQLMMNSISFVLITVVIVGTLIHFEQYQITYQERTNYRQAIDLAESMLSSKCLAFEENGRVWRGVLDKTKLDGLSS